MNSSRSLDTALVLRFRSRYEGPIVTAWKEAIPPCAQEPRPTFEQTGLFESVDVMLDFLRQWSRNGWTYLVTSEDAEANRNPKSVPVRSPGRSERAMALTPFRTRQGEVRVIAGS